MLNPLYGGSGGNLDIGNESLSVSLIPLFLSKCTVLDYLRVIIIFKLRPESFITQLGLLEQIIISTEFSKTVLLEVWTNN